MAKTRQQIVDEMQKYHYAIQNNISEIGIHTYSISNLNSLTNAEIETCKLRIQKLDNNNFELAQRIMGLYEELNIISPNDVDFRHGGKRDCGEYYHIIDGAESIIAEQEQNTQPGA